MTTEVTAFDYQALPSVRALEVRAVAERIHQRTTVAVIENGRDLLAVREMPEMKGRFVAWLNYEAEQRLVAEIKRHHEFLAHIGSAEREAPVQIEAAERLMAALSDAMIELHGFEHAPLPPAARKLAMAQQMCAQLADAITAFLAARVSEPQPSPIREAFAPARTVRTGKPTFALSLRQEATGNR